MPRELSKCREWEKERRNRLNDAFTTLCKLLPCYDPAVNISKIDVLKNSAAYIEELQTKIKNLTSENNEESLKKVKGEECRKLQERVKRLLSKNEQLCTLLRQAKITIPPGCGVFRKFKTPPLFWSNRVLPEQAKILQKKELEKENDASAKKATGRKFTNKKQNKVGGQSSTPKHRKAILNRSDSKKLRTSKKKKVKSLTPSKCVIVLSQPSITQPCYVITNTSSNNIIGGTSTVITNSGLVANSLVSSKPTKTVSSMPPLGPGTLILANGTIMPVLPQQTVLPLASQIITRPPIILLPKKPVSAPSTTSAVGSTQSGKIVSSSVKTLARIRPKHCLTKTTQVNKVPIPALTSRYSNSEVVVKKTEPKPAKAKPIEKKTAVKEPEKKIETPENGEKRKVATSEVGSEAKKIKLAEDMVVSSKKVQIQEAELKKVPQLELEKETIQNEEKDEIEEIKNADEKSKNGISSKVSETDKNSDETLELNMNHSELSNDIFASLQVPAGCQNPESTSPTAAFLLAFPLVSSLTGVKVAEVTEEDNTESQRGTPTLLQIGTMDSTKSTQSETLTPSLLNLDNLSFFSSKDISGFYNSFEGSITTTTAAASVVSTVTTKTTEKEKGELQQKNSDYQQQRQPQTQSMPQLQQQSRQQTQLPHQQSQRLHRQSQQPHQQAQQPQQLHQQTQQPHQQTQQPHQQTQQPHQQTQQPHQQTQQPHQQTQQPHQQTHQQQKQSHPQPQQLIQRQQQPHKQSQQPLQQTQPLLHQPQQTQQPLHQPQQPQQPLHQPQQPQQPLHQPQQPQQPLHQPQQPLQQTQPPLHQPQQPQQPLQQTQPPLHQPQQPLHQPQQPQQPLHQPQQSQQPLQQTQPPLHQPQQPQQPLQQTQPPLHQPQQPQQPLQQSQQPIQQSQQPPQQPQQPPQQPLQQTQQPLQSHQQPQQQPSRQQSQQHPHPQLPQQQRQQEKNQLVPCFDNRNLIPSFGATNSTISQPLSYQSKSTSNVENKQPCTNNYSSQKVFNCNNFNEAPKVSTTCSYANAIKSYPEPLYTNSGTYTYSNSSDINLNQNYYKDISKTDNRSYYSLNYENYADYRKNDSSNNTYFSTSNYYPNTNYSKEKFNTNTSNTPKNKNSGQSRPPINWMTTPDNRLQTPSEYVLPQFTKEPDFYPTNTFTNTQTTYFNTNPMYNNEAGTTNQEVRKSLDLALVPPVNTSYQRNEVEDNQFSWSPTKIPQFLDPPPSFVSSTLPTLVGDLALGNPLSFGEQKVDKCQKKETRRLKSYEGGNNQGNFLSVSQLVDHNKEVVPARATARRNSGGRSSGKKVAQKSSQRKEKDVYPQNNKAEGNGKGLKQLGYSSTEVFCDKNRNVAKNSYSAEALIGHQMQSDGNQKRQQNYSTNKTISVSSFLHDNIIPYFPAVDLPQENTYMQQNQNYQTSSFSHNFQSTFQSNTYTANSFIPTTSAYNFMHDVTHDYSENLNLFPVSKEKNCTKSTNRNIRDQQCSTTAPKKSKRKHSNELPGFVDFPFLSMPGTINSPILPDDFHTHTGFLQPPTSQLYPCKNPFTKPNEVVSGSLLPLPPVPVTRSNIQHPEISPSINNAGTSLTNFNLSTIFPEINNKSALSDPYSGKEHPRSYTSTVQVSFNDKPTFSFSYINSTTSQPYNNQ